MSEKNVAHERERCARVAEERRDSNAERQKMAAEAGDTKNAEWFRARACIADSIAEEIREFREPLRAEQTLTARLTEPREHPERLIEIRLGAEVLRMRPTHAEDFARAVLALADKAGLEAAREWFAAQKR